MSVTRIKERIQLQVTEINKKISLIAIHKKKKGNSFLNYLLNSSMLKKKKEIGEY